MNRYVAWLVTATSLAVGAQTARAGSGIGVKVGTLGLGVEVTRTMGPRMNARAGVNFFDYEYSISDDGIDYTGDVGLLSGALLADVHPVPLLGLRLSGGLLFNGNELDLVGAPAATTVMIGDEEYTIDSVGEVHGSIGFGSVAPYAGIGWGNAAGGIVGFSVDLGIAFQGTPTVEFSTTGLLAEDEAFLQELAQEEKNFAESLESFKYYPVVSVGLSVKLSMF